MNSSSEELTYEDHNLWILDDRFAFYSYFNSDRKFRQYTNYNEATDDRADITLFDASLGFNPNDASQPVTIIEFKRPKLGSYTVADNPIRQVRKYVTQLRDAKKITRFDGEVIRRIDDHTPFHCHIVADDEPKLLEIMEEFGPFEEKTGYGCYYKWDSGYKIYIEITSLDELIRLAKARNNAFFEKLGLQI